MYKKALVSVSDKSGLISFCSQLHSQGTKLVSTGGSAKTLREAGIPCQDVSELTGFPEVLGGRVKTLHPFVHMGILSRREQDKDTLGKFNLEEIDLVICNLYPFQKTVAAQANQDEVIENIDIGGVTLLRAAAKNFQYVTVVSDPNDYHEVLVRHDDLVFRKKLATKAFIHTAEYDQAISSYFLNSSRDVDRQQGELVHTLRYGENPQQMASWYKTAEQGLHQAIILQGKELSYNNLLDLDAGLSLAQRFDQPFAVVLKHNNPCGAAVHSNCFLAMQKALQADPISAFGGIIVCNFEMNAEHISLFSKLFVECIMAKNFSREFLDSFSKKPQVRLLKFPFDSYLDGKTPQRFELKSVQGGYLKQDVDQAFQVLSDYQVFGEEPTKEMWETIYFGEKICAALKSNAIAVVQDKQTLGLGMGQVNRIDSVDLALKRARNVMTTKQDLILVSDAFFPFKDSVEKIAEAEVKWIVQPGGSLRDQEVVQACKDFKINLILTGRRHFKH